MSTIKGTSLKNNATIYKMCTDGVMRVAGHKKEATRKQLFADKKAVSDLVKAEVEADQKANPKTSAKLK